MVCKCRKVEIILCRSHCLLAAGLVTGVTARYRSARAQRPADTRVAAGRGTWATTSYQGNLSSSSNTFSGCDAPSLWNEAKSTVFFSLGVLLNFNDCDSDIVTIPKRGDKCDASEQYIKTSDTLLRMHSWYGFFIRNYLLSITTPAVITDLAMYSKET